MSDYLQPGQHPDPDSLNSFIEGVLPEHERLQCLAHLAECPACREVVYFAQEPLAPETLRVPSPETIPFWKRWVGPIPALGFGAAAGILVLSAWLYQHRSSAVNAPELVAIAPRAEAAKEPLQYSLSVPAKPTAIKDPVQPPPLPQSVPLEVPRVPIPLAVLPPSAAPAPAPAMTAPAAPVTSVASAAVSATPQAKDRAVSGVLSVPQRSAMLDAVRANALSGSASGISGIAGTITDPAGAAISGATVKLRPVMSSVSRSLTSDRVGQFNVDGLEPGQYELQVSAPGFKRLTEQVEVQPSQVARADSTLSLGSVSESIMVTAQVAQVQTETSSKAAKKDAVKPLPTKLPANTTVVKGKLMLATDSAGALFLSKNAGKNWSAVKPVWQGKVASLVALSAPASSSGPAFQLTTDTGAVWLSRDGNRWYAAPAQK